MRPVLIALALAAFAAPSTARDLNHVPEATPAGNAVNCISLSRIRDTMVRSDKVIDFRMIGGKVYRNELPQACPGLGFEQRYSHKTSIDQFCSTDIITVLYTSPLQDGASCGLGKFQPVTLAAH